MSVGFNGPPRRSQVILVILTKRYGATLRAHKISNGYSRKYNTNNAVITAPTSGTFTLKTTWASSYGAVTTIHEHRR